MRLRPGRPDVARYERRFGLPDATDGALGVRFLGVSTLLFDDGASAFMTDGFFTRPGLLNVLRGPIPPDSERIDRCLARAAPSKLAAIVPVHTHYDHALDTATVAQRTGATLVGGTSAANVGRGHGLPEQQIRVAAPGMEYAFGAYDVVLVVSAHCPPDRFPGTIDTPVPRRSRAGAYRCGEAWSVLLRHRPSGRTALVQGSAGFVPGTLAGHAAEVALLGVGMLGVQSEHYIRQYWAETVVTVGARRAVLIHWDDFFRPLDKPLRALPYAGDDLDVTMRVLSDCAAADGVDLRLPTVWQRADPWR